MTKIQVKNIKFHFGQEILSKSMSSSISKDLPPKLLENVLACLPTHVVCHFRLVCKEWNHLISQPSFATLCAFSPPKESLIFISPKLNYRRPSTLLAAWHVLDPTEKHFYKLSDSFIMDSYLSSNRNRGLGDTSWDLGWCKYTLAAHGEFIYTNLYSTRLSKNAANTHCLQSYEQELP